MEWAGSRHTPPERTKALPLPLTLTPTRPVPHTLGLISGANVHSAAFCMCQGGEGLWSFSGRGTPRRA